MPSAKRIVKIKNMSNVVEKNCINNTMKNSQENGKFKIICIRVPKWLAFILRKFAKDKK